MDEQLQDDYRAFSRTAVYMDLMSYLDQERDSALSIAEDSDEPLKAVSHLQKASAYKTIKSYVERMSAPME